MRLHILDLWKGILLRAEDSDGDQSRDARKYFVQTTGNHFPHYGLFICFDFILLLSFQEGGSILMDQPSGMDQMDRRILRTLSNYERLTPLQLWYELSGDGAVTRRLNETEILNRLESLREKGLVERVTGIEVSSDPRLSIYRVRTSTRMAGAIGDDLSRD